MLSALVGAALLAWVGPPPVCPPPTPLAVYRTTAPKPLRAYLDPIAAGALATVLELRRLSAERGGEIQVELWIVRSPGFDSVSHDRVRLWVYAMGRADRLIAALRLVAQEGIDRIEARLLTTAGRAEIANLMDLAPSRHAAVTAEPCAEHDFERASAGLARTMAAAGNVGYRLPVFRVDEQLFEEDSKLEKLRPALGRTQYRERRLELAGPAAPPEPRAHSARMRRPPLGGAVLGGRGLPHVFVLMARDEDDPNLLALLPPVLAYRRRFGAELAVHVVARGKSLGGQRLRHRLCAATLRGHVVQYVGYLATEPSLRGDAVDRELLESLDSVPEPACETDPDPADLGLPDGGWLDGLPRNRAELESLPATLDSVRASVPPLQRILSTAPEEP